MRIPLEANVSVSPTLDALVLDGSFMPASRVDGAVPLEFGLYAIRLARNATLPEPFDSILRQRSTRLIYVGKARTQSLHQRLVSNELRARGHGTFFRSLGAVLGYRPPRGSLAGHARQQNYQFGPIDRDAVIAWIDAHLEVSWIVLPQIEKRAAEVALIRALKPLLNLDDNPLALAELRELRAECRLVAGSTI